MTVAEVQSAVPEAVRPAKPDTLGNGARGILEVPNVEITARTFTATFFFLDQRLTQVTLGMDAPGSFNIGKMHFESLLDALRVKYGKEQSLSNENLGGLKTREATWLSGKTNVGLLLLAVGDAESTLNINYQVSLAKEAEKL